MASAPKYVKFLEFFKKLQKENKVLDPTNIVYAKWDMKMVVEAIDNDKHMEQLIRFFMLYSDDKTFACFFKEYHSYYESMLAAKRDRAHRKYLREKTILKEKGEDLGS